MSRSRARAHGRAALQVRGLREGLRRQEQHARASADSLVWAALQMRPLRKAVCAQELLEEARGEQLHATGARCTCKLYYHHLSTLCTVWHLPTLNTTTFNNLICNSLLGIPAIAVLFSFSHLRSFSKITLALFNLKVVINTNFWTSLSLYRLLIGTESIGIERHWGSR